MTQIAGYILAAVLLIFWRLDIWHAACERRDLYNRIQAGSLATYKAHTRDEDPEDQNIREVPLFGDDEQPSVYTEEELEQLRDDIQAARLLTARGLHE